MLKAKLPAHARFWNAGGTFADRPAELAHCAARVRLRARSLWLMSGMCGLSLEVTDRLHDELARGAPVLERLIADGSLAGSRRRRSTS